MSEILHKNAHHITIERVDHRLWSQVLVVSHSDGKRYILQRYRFKNIPERFSSPYLSWANLDCCGGWCYEERYLATAVQEGKKLYAGLAVGLKHPYNPNAPTREEAAAFIEDLRKTLPDQLTAGMEANQFNERYLYTYICRCGAICDHIDLDAVFSYYEKLEINLSDSVRDQVRRYCSVEIERYAGSAAPYNYLNTNTAAKLIATGLLLGYPIESTASLLA